MSDESFDFVCTTCARSNTTVEAVKYCVECSGYCCQSCTDIHKNFPALIGHNISDITQASKASTQQSILTEFPTERCSIHKIKVLDMYCEHHDTVGCYVCFAKYHKFKITKDIPGNKLFTNSRHVTFNARGNRMFVGDLISGLVCFDGMGNYLSTITDTDLEYVNGARVDGRGNMFVVGCTSHNVEQFSEDGKKVGVVVKQGDGLHYPRSVCFHTQLNRLFVAMDNATKMFELE